MKHDFKFFVKEGAGNMFSHGFMSFAAIGVTVACLLIMGTFTLVAYNANENLADLQRENAIVAFVDETLDEDQARALQSQVEAVANVADCSFVTRTEARDAYVAKYDAEGVYGDLLPEVFRHRYVIHVTDPDHIMDTKESVEQVPGIAKARADEAVANGFVTVRNVAGVISIALIAILLLVSVFIISNTIKLTTFATNGFIRWPFVCEGLLLGTLSAAVAFGLQWLLYLAVAKGIASSDSLQILHIVPFTDIWYIVALVFLAAGILVGVGGSLTAIRRFLRV
ncbi:MAG: ABC transporter permease [Firmicutes bacterium CAG:176_59_8]|nr:MAG: ABC transporter permease [Firmicutes bacterium CAG:176_59_8]